MRRSDEQRPADSDGDERKYSGVPHGDNSPTSARQSRMHSSQAGGMQKIVEQFKAVEEVPDALLQGASFFSFTPCHWQV